ncbi:methyl-accepting chemotaxis protein [Massilia sp. LjRoot122]|uniref:methyl-accepting chemotaxis protein n=1 Tax=Massilia sp. LjRoot122 TaxID=3342257 RepID=UPI003ECF566A
MAFFSNASTRAKLVAGFGLMIALLAGVSALTYHATTKMEASQRALFEDDLEIAFDAMRVRNELNRDRVAMLSAVVGDPGGADAAATLTLSADVMKNLADIGLKLDAGARLPQGPGGASAGNVANYGQLAASLRDYMALREREVAPLLAAGRRQEAGRAIVGPLQQRFVALRDIAERVSNQEFAHATARMHATTALGEQTRGVLLAANLAALLAAAALVYWLDRIIAAPLKQATQVAGRIATGDLSVAVPAPRGKDEVGQLLAALGQMVGAWRQLMTETNSGIATLGAAATEILASTMQGAAGASQTAAAVSETTATVEEVKQTAMLTSDKSRRVSDAARQATGTAERGRQAVEEGMRGMRNVQEQMESIAGTIVRLSERSQAIADITATVGDLADQSNLLAVNAAIEAAKAGEHGKGFGVVAQEVRALAEQSRQATRQVREILGDIQKSIGAAVMITEQGSKTVAQGVAQSQDAGEAIRSLAEGIADAAEAAAQIAASSQQQLAGMDQVALAMSNIHQVSAENAASSRQAEQAAQNLNELGLTLRQLSERFKV